MMLIFFVGILSLFLLYYIFETLRTKRMRQIINNVPGPKGYPFIGAALEFGTNSIDILKNLQSLSEKHGPVFHAWVGPTLHVVLSGSKDVEAVLSSTTHLNKPLIYDFLNKWLGKGLITSPASKWKIQRRVLTPAFHMKILESYIDIFNSNTKIMMELLEKEVGKEKFDIGPYVDKCTLDVICETAMATSIHAQLNEGSKFTKSLKIVSKSVLVRGFKPWLFPEFTFNMSSVGRDFNKHLDYINKYVDNVISQKKKALEESKNDEPIPNLDDVKNEVSGYKKRPVFLDLLLQYAKDPSTQITDKDLRDEVHTFMFAGHDTTASTVGFAIYMLALHPGVQAKVIDEIKSVIGESEKDPSFSELTNLKYLEQVIKETLRLYPAVPFIGRYLYEDLTLPSGYTLPAGSSLFLLFFKLHRDANVFPDPEVFDPDHFLPERVAGRFTFAHTPFSAGPRNCIGQKFSMLEMKAILVKLLRTYKVFAATPEPVLASELVLRSVTGINVRLEKRK